MDAAQPTKGDTKMNMIATIPTDCAAWGSETTEKMAARFVDQVVRAFERAGWTVNLSEYLRGTDEEHYNAEIGELSEGDEPEKLDWFPVWCEGGSRAVYRMARAAIAKAEGR